MSANPSDGVLGVGRHLQLRRRQNWEFVERKGVADVVVLVAVTAEQEAVLVEQYREPVQAKVIEWPAGLVGDEEAVDGETMLEAAARELEEETGFRAGRFEILTTGPSSGGLTSEIVTFLRPSDLERAAQGGGVEGENIRVHLVPLLQVDAWLSRRAEEGFLIDPKVYTGLYFLSKR